MSVVLVALPLALVAAPVLPGPPWVAGAWLLPAFACAGAHPRPLHLDPRPARRRRHLPGVGRRGRLRRRTRTGSRGSGALGTGAARLPRHRPASLPSPSGCAATSSHSSGGPREHHHPPRRRDPSLRLHDRAGRARPRPVHRHHRPARSQRRRQDHAAADPGHRARAERRSTAGSSGSTRDVPEERTGIRRRLGYLPQESGYPRGFTAFRFVDYVAALKEWTEREARHREVRRVLGLVGLSDLAGKRMRTPLRWPAPPRRARPGPDRVAGPPGPRRADHRPRPRAAGVAARRALRRRAPRPRCCWPRTRPRTSRPCASG